MRRNCAPWFEVIVLVSQEFELLPVIASDTLNEPVTALAHALQCAQLAESAGAETALVAAAMAVTLDSEVGRGTAVTIYLPRAVNAAAVETGENVSPAAEPVQGTVLVVEDSRDVADVTTALLEQLGYRVVRAENATDALRHLQQNIAFDLVLSDIVMPGAIDGLGLAQVCRERFPDIPLLLTSGYSEAAQAADGRFDILRKPFELSALERAIETVRSNGAQRSRSY